MSRFRRTSPHTTPLYTECLTLHGYFGGGAAMSCTGSRRGSPRAVSPGAPRRPSRGGAGTEGRGRWGSCLMTVVDAVTDTVAAVRRAVAELHAELPRYDLVVWTAGNVCARVPGADLMVIKPFGVSYAELTPDSMVICDLHGRLVDGVQKPCEAAAAAYVHRHQTSPVGSRRPGVCRAGRYRGRMQILNGWRRGIGLTFEADCAAAGNPNA